MDKKKSRLRDLRRERGLSSEYIAAKLGITKQQYWLYERDPQKIRADKLIFLADLLGAPSLDYIYEREPKKQKVTAYEMDCLNKLRDMKKENRKMIYKLIRMTSEYDQKEKKEKKE